jgi:hypothetical protein
MRVAAGSANAMDLAAARSIAQLVCSVDMALERPSYPAVKVADIGKARVNRVWKAHLLAETGRRNQAPE